MHNHKYESVLVKALEGLFDNCLDRNHARIAQMPTFTSLQLQLSGGKLPITTKHIVRLKVHRVWHSYLLIDLDMTAMPVKHYVKQDYVGTLLVLKLEPVAVVCDLADACVDYVAVVRKTGGIVVEDFFAEEIRRALATNLKTGEEYHSDRLLLTA